MFYLLFTGYFHDSINKHKKNTFEPVDILVNGKLIAHGEVVVIDENFGVRITDIIPGGASKAAS